jgi:hypothetical protein
MPSSSQIRRAVKLFEGFHEYEMKDTGRFDPKLTIPRFVFSPGACAEVRYRSNKWGDGSILYYHPIDSFPKVTVGLLRQHEGKPRRLPAAVSSMDQALIRIGSCVKDSVIFEDGEGDASVSFPAKSEWFFSPSSRALFVISQRRHLHCVIWGGKLNVENRGIVG